jgi:hypothetical protein
MSDLSTFAGQAEHYAAVRARLMGGYARREIGARLPTGRMVVPVPFDFISAPSWRNLLRFVSLQTGIGESDIMSRGRDLVIAHGRSMLMSLMRSHMDMTYEAICTFWGYEASAALSAVKRYESGKSAVRFKQRLARIAKGPSRPKRERPAIMTKWTAEEIAEAQQMRAEGALLKDLAEYFGVSENAVGAMLQRAAKRRASQSKSRVIHVEMHHPQVGA